MQLALAGARKLVATRSIDLTGARKLVSTRSIDPAGAHNQRGKLESNVEISIRCCLVKAPNQRGKLERIMEIAMAEPFAIIKGGNWRALWRFPWWEPITK